MKGKNDSNLGLIDALIGILVAFMVLLPALVTKNDDLSFTGLEVAFGKEFANLGDLASGEITATPLVLVAFALPLVGALFALFVNKGYLLAMISYIAATIMLFMAPELVTVEYSALDATMEGDVEWKYGIGSILAMGLSVFGIVLSLFKIYRENA
ncbi:MAG: hypothetical protein ACLFTZ_03625 [Acholeplasmataceae bacterium]